jgi:PAS domain S-box-containing protein
MDLEATFEQLPVGVAHSDRAGHILKFNAAFCRMLGFEPADLSRKTIAQITYPEDVERSRGEMERLWRGEIPSYTLEKRYIAKSGDVTWVRLTAALLRASSGTVESAVGILEDISARRLAEEQLARLHQEMVTASRQAGKAEVAADVLHNLGNALNSVTVSAGVVADRLRESPATNLRRVAALVTAHSADLARFLHENERGRQLPEYLTQLAERLLAHQAHVAEELTSLRAHLERVIGIVATQQRHLGPARGGPSGTGPA